MRTDVFARGVDDRLAHLQTGCEPHKALAEAHGNEAREGMKANPARRWLSRSLTTT
jgi:hypothetical protein